MSAGTWLYLLLSFVTLLGLGLNVYILIVALLSKELATGNKLLLIHLSIVNVILSLLFLLFFFLHIFGFLWRRRHISFCFSFVQYGFVFAFDSLPQFGLYYTTPR
uniref:G-protein coupled receptors family 1 profile domain-containing protein n=1 Tax=Cacopsylla melanoneura TaxID=428564 RepID=A0A8D8Q2M2_9HEMI